MSQDLNNSLNILYFVPKLSELAAWKLVFTMVHVKNFYFILHSKNKE